MIFRIREPRSQQEIDRNLLVLCWLMILPSVGILFRYSTALLIFLLAGGLARLLIVAIRLPDTEREFFRPLLSGFMILVGLVIQLEMRTEVRFEFSLLLLVYFWGCIAFADSRFLRYNRTQRIRSLEPDHAASGLPPAMRDPNPSPDLALGSGRDDSNGPSWRNLK